jgi:hypothetical protein
MEPTDDEDDRYRQLLIRQRELYVESLHAASDQYDNWIFKLSGGSLAIALGFVRTRVEAVPAIQWALGLSLGLFTMSLLATLFSLWMSHREHADAIRRLNKVLEQQDTRAAMRASLPVEGKKTALYDGLAGGFLVLGLSVLAVFVGVNLEVLR